MTKASDKFFDDLSALHQTVRDVMGNRLEDERARILKDLLENQINGILLFYELLLGEQEAKLTIDEAEFDLLTQKFRTVLKYFRALPKAHPNSTYNLSVISDFFYILRNHTVEWGE